MISAPAAAATHEKSVVTCSYATTDTAPLSVHFWPAVEGCSMFINDDTFLRRVLTPGRHQL